MCDAARVCERLVQDLVRMHVRVCHARLMCIRRELSEPPYQLFEFVGVPEAYRLCTSETSRIARVVQVWVLLVRVFGQVEKGKVLRGGARVRGSFGGVLCQSSPLGT